MIPISAKSAEKWRFPIRRWRKASVCVSVFLLKMGHALLLLLTAYAWHAEAECEARRHRLSGAVVAYMGARWAADRAETRIFVDERGEAARRTVTARELSL